MHKWACKSNQYFSWCKLNLTSGNQHLPQRPGFHAITIFCSENLFTLVALFMFASIHSIRKSTKVETPKQENKR